MGDPISRRAVLASATTITAGTAGCVASSRNVEESISETIDPDGANALTVSGEAGSVEVVGESRETVALEGRTRAATEDDLEDVSVDVDRSGDTVAVVVDDGTGNGLFSFGPGPVVDLELAVPDSLRVAAVDTGSGSIDVRDVRGPLEADTGSGSIAIENVEGALETDTGSGSQTLEGVEESLTAETGSGSIAAEFDSLADDTSLETGSGSVSLTLPAEADATIEISTGSGTATVRGSGVDRVETNDDVATTVGDGTHAVEIETGSGDVDVIVGS